MIKQRPPWLGSTIGNRPGDPLIPVDTVVINVPELLHGGTVITASSGGGKTYAVRKLLEETYGTEGLIHLVIDPEGELHTLREKFDYVLAGPGGDCAATVEQAPLLARRMLQYRFSLIVNLYDLGMARADYVKAFLEAMMLAPRDLDGDVLVVLEEAQLFVPERGEAPSSSEHAVKDFMARGRKRGWRPILSTQRLASISKTAAALCQNSLIGLTTLDDDQDRAKKRLGFGRDPHWRSRLDSLGPGHFFAVGPAFGCRTATEIAVGAVQTSHGRTNRKRAATPPPASLARVLARLQDIPQAAEAEASEVERLRARVAELESQVERDKMLDVSSELEEIADRNGKTADKLAKKLEAEEAKNTALDDANLALHQKLDELAEKLKTLAGTVGDLVQEAEDAVSANYHLYKEPEPGKSGTERREKRDARPGPGSTSSPVSIYASLLGVLADVGPSTRQQALLYTLRARNGTTDQAFASMLAGDAHQDGHVLKISDKGRAHLAAAWPTRTPTLRREALRAAYLSKLSTTESKLLAVFIDAATRGLWSPRVDRADFVGFVPQGLSRGEALERIGRKRNGTTDKAFAMFLRRGLVVEGPGHTLIIAKELFS